MSKDNIELKDVIHLYLNAEAVVEQSDYHMVHNWAVRKGDKIIIDGNVIFYINSRKALIAIIKPILRKLDSMTEEESSEQNQLFNKAMFTESLPEAEMVKYLLSKQFDLFGLIENNLAIDKNEKQ